MTIALVLQCSWAIQQHFAKTIQQFSPQIWAYHPQISVVQKNPTAVNYHHRPSLCIITACYNVAPAVIERKTLQPSLCANKVRSRVLRGYYRGFPWISRGCVGMNIKRECRDVTARGKTAVMGTVSRYSRGCRTSVPTPDYNANKKLINR